MRCVQVVPPLRDRGEDIGLLADACLDEAGPLSGADLFDGPRRRVLDDPQWLRFLDRSWDEAKDEFARWYWTGVWQRYQGDKHKIADHADVSQVWLRSRRKLYELTGG